MTVEFYDPKFIQNNPWQTRQRDPDAAYIEELAADIKKNGLLQTPMGRVISINGAGAVQLAFGHNRLRAYLLLKLPMMPVDIRALTDEQMAAFAWSENEKRRDVTAIERAKAIQQRITDFKWSNREAAEALGVDHSTISNMLRLLKLPDELQVANMEGKLSERQAVAILPLFELPGEFDKRILNSYYYKSPKEIIKMAMNGSSSDEIRSQIESLFNSVTQDLGKADFKLDKLIPEENGVYCGLCSTCDKRLKNRSRCVDSVCYEAKTKYVHRQYLEKASLASGYGLIDDTKGGYTTSLPSGSWEQKKREQVLATKCPNLRLEYTENKNKDIDGFPNARIVCDKRNNTCTCIRGIELMGKQDYLAKVTAQEAIDDDGLGDEAEEIEGEEISSEEAEAVALEQAQGINNLELEDVVRQQRKAKMELDKNRDEIERKLAKHLLQAIEKLEPGAFYIAVRHDRYPNQGELNLGKIFKYLANEGARSIMPIGAHDIAQHIKWINEILVRLELEPFSLDEPKPVRVQVEEVKIPIL